MQFDIAIIGCGPNATYALDRIAAVVKRLPRNRVVRIAIFERSGNFGDGCVHDTDQPRSSYLNRASGDIALGAHSITSIQSDFWCWYRSRNAAGEIDADERPLTPTSTPSRALHGRALRDALLASKAQIESENYHSCHLLIDEVIELDGDSDQGPLGIKTKSGRRYEALHILLATGHGQPQLTDEEHVLGLATGGRFIDWPYPLSRLDDLNNLSNSAICVDGLGLSAIDVLLYLTEGRGGRFVRTPSGDLDYIPGGREPRYLTAIGRSGLLIPTRPKNNKVERGRQHKAVVLTPERLQTLRVLRGFTARLPDGRLRQQLDFERDILPLIALEMAFLYYATGAAKSARKRLRLAAIAAADRFTNAVPTVITEPIIQTLCDELACTTSMTSTAPAFNWADQTAWFGQRTDFHKAALKAAEEDISEARRGNLRSPSKAAADGVWRDLRPILQGAIEFGGLTALSERIFQDRYWRLYSRLSNGSSIEAMEKIIALVRNNIVDLSNGPGATLKATQSGIVIEGASPRHICTVIRGRLSRFDARSDRSPLYRSAIANKLLSLWANPDTGGGPAFQCGAIAISERCYALRDDGSEDTRISLIGSPIEGVRYFRESLARAIDDGIFTHFERWAVAALAQGQHPT